MTSSSKVGCTTDSGSWWVPGLRTRMTARGKRQSDRDLAATDSSRCEAVSQHGGAKDFKGSGAPVRGQGQRSLADQTVAENWAGRRDRSSVTASGVLQTFDPRSCG